MDERFNVELEQLLQDRGRDFLSLSGVCKVMPSALRARLGLKSNSRVGEVQKALQPHMGRNLEIRKAGRSLCLVRRGEKDEMLLRSVQARPGKSPKTLRNSLPFTAAEFLRLTNSLLKEGRLRVELNARCEPLLFAVSPEGPPTLQPQPLALAPVPDAEAEKAVLRAAFQELEQGRIFVRICDLRRRLGWSREAFDSALARLRRERTVQLHSGDVSAMTQEELQDSFVDENGFRMLSLTWTEAR
ncbi:MAG: hypothetical protein GX256_05690 [Fretibacterium sp.]|nr:hypothetical protein [Fretibacterium sp.]